MLSDLRKALDGKKTMIGSVAAGALILAYSLGLIDEATAGTLASVIVTFTGVSFRLAVKKGS